MRKETSTTLHPILSITIFVRHNFQVMQINMIKYDSFEQIWLLTYVTLQMDTDTLNAG